MPVALEATRDGDAWWAEIDGRELRLSNLTKVFWPDEGYTKGDLLAYYANVASLIVPHLAERPLTMKRMPDGIDGPFFYEKSAPSHTPDWLGRCVVQSEDAKGGEIDYLTIADTAGLLYVANLGCIEFHPLHSRCADVVHPDYLFFDLDPFEPYTYEDVLVVTRHIKVLLDQLGLPSFPKTSGATGPADLRAGPARHLLLRPRARVRGRRRPPDQGRRPRPRHDGVEDRRSHREDLHRPQHEPLGGEHRGRVLGAARAASVGLDAAHVGRGLRGRLRAGRLPHRQRLGTVRTRRRPVRGRAHRGGGPHVGARGARGRPRAGRRRRGAARGRRSPSSDRGEGRRGAHGGGDRGGVEGPGAVRVRPAARLRPRGHHRARARRGHADRQLVRDPQAPRDQAALRRPAGEGRRAAVVGGAQGVAARQRRQAARGADRGASARIRDSSRARSPRATTARARCASSTTAGTNRSSGPTRRSRSCCTAGATPASSSTS